MRDPARKACGRSNNAPAKAGAQRAATPPLQKTHHTIRFPRSLPARAIDGRVGRPGGHSEGQNTRSHPELGRENPQRQWYCALRRGRVGRRQARQTAQTHQTLIAGWSKPALRTTPSGLVSLITVERPSEAKLSCWSNNTPERRSGAHRQDTHNAGWSSPVARQAHNLKVIGSNPIPATKLPH